MERKRGNFEHKHQMFYSRIARLSGDLALMQKQMAPFFGSQSHSAGKKVQISNFNPEDLAKIIDFIDCYRIEMNYLLKDPENAQN